MLRACLSFLHLLYVNLAVNVCLFSCHLNHTFCAKSNYGTICLIMLKPFLHWTMPQLLAWTKWCFLPWAWESRETCRKIKSGSPPALHRNDCPSSGRSVIEPVCTLGCFIWPICYAVRKMPVCLFAGNWNEWFYKTVRGI